MICTHYSDVIMGAMASLITSIAIVYSNVYSDADQRKHQSSVSLVFVWGIHLWPVNYDATVSDCTCPKWQNRDVQSILYPLLIKTRTTYGMFRSDSTPNRSRSHLCNTKVYQNRHWGCDRSFPLPANLHPGNGKDSKARDWPPHSRMRTQHRNL